MAWILQRQGVWRDAAGRHGSPQPVRKLVFAFSLCWLIPVGCSQAARDRFMHFFFEIPDETQPTAEPQVLAWAEPRSLQPTAFKPRWATLHPPFVQRQCLTCHDSTHQMHAREDLLDSCSACHPRFFSEEVTHAPVGDGECLECHEMHRTMEPHLLTIPVFVICIECHEEPEDLSEPAHTVEGVEQCTACHDAHFGAQAHLKPRPGIAVPQ